MTPREVIAEALEDSGILLHLTAADSILSALEQAGYVVVPAEMVEQSVYYTKILAHAERTENHLPPKLRAEIGAWLRRKAEGNPNPEDAYKQGYDAALDAMQHDDNA